MIMMIMMITDGESAGHENDEYDNNHHNFVWLKWFLPYLDRAFYYFLRPKQGASGICFLDYIQMHCNGGMVSSFCNFYIFVLTS